MRMKPKILFAVTGQEFVRNYFSTAALAALEAEADVTFLVSDRLTDPAPVTSGNRKVLFFRSDPRKTKAQMNIYKVLMWRFRHLSSTFRFRADRIFAPKRAYQPWRPDTILKNFDAFRERLGIAYRRLRLRILGSRLVFPLYRRMFIDTLKPSPDIAAAFAQVRPDLLVAPSNAYEPDGNEMILQAQKDGVPSLFLIDNWDNLSSKAVLMQRPDHLAVWGEQTLGHATDIQSYDAADVTILGTPRFDAYFEARDTELPSPFDHPYILFLGTSLAFDEVEALKHIDAIMSADPVRWQGVKLVYRPHPWRQSRDTIADTRLENVILDPQLADRHLTGERHTGFQPDLSWYPRLLANAEFTLGGLTSMLIEATIFGKQFVALTYDDGKHVTNQKTVLERSEHFRGVERIHTVSFCREKSDVEPLMRAAWDGRKTIDRDRVDRERNYILFHDGKAYDRRLAELCASLLEE
ncbi:hypothetical protein N8I71_15050 [Roseibacterium sp. SDUM158016]|uniref:hypothetical protein n=1 Tax=Roseicyclus sediminis TaxID=2980997 RepID=UPI0021CFB99F|nr:hypothetical protein [Roseibacterium sp. SDUM158016]MCU4654161.1 hypothetical protein [Roseibacterium sp. SDUM158016]